MSVRICHEADPPAVRLFTQKASPHDQIKLWAVLVLVSVYGTLVEGNQQHTMRCQSSFFPDEELKHNVIDRLDSSAFKHCFLNINMFKIY